MIGLDIEKNEFQVHGVDTAGQVPIPNCSGVARMLKAAMPESRRSRAGAPGRCASVALTITTLRRCISATSRYRLDSPGAPAKEYTVSNPTIFKVAQHGYRPKALADDATSFVGD